MIATLKIRKKVSDWQGRPQYTYINNILKNNEKEYDLIELAYCMDVLKSEDKTEYKKLEKLAEKLGDDFRKNTEQYKLSLESLADFLGHVDIGTMIGDRRRNSTGMRGRNPEKYNALVDGWKWYCVEQVNNLNIREQFNGNGYW